MLFALMLDAPIFQDQNQLSLDLFMVFLFPFFLALIASVVSLVCTAIVRQKWWISVPLSIVLLGLPLMGYLFTWLAAWVARFFYISTPEDEERTKKFLSMAIVPQTEKPPSELEQIKKMKALLDEGIVTPAEFNLQRQKLLSDIERETAFQNTPRYFSIWQAVAAGALGGFLAGAVLIAINFKRLDKKEQYKSSLLVGALGFMIAVTISAATTMILTSLSAWLIIPVTLVYPILIYLWHNETMQDAISNLVITKQARNESWWLVFGISLVAVVINYLVAIPVLIIIAYFQPAA